MKTTLSHMAWRIAPPWLVNLVGKSYLSLFGQTLDSQLPGAFTMTGLLDKAKQAIYARMPKRCQPDALPLLAADRGLVQGPSESAASFGERLSLAFDAWDHAGAARAVMEQIIAYFQGQAVQPAGDWPVAAVVGTDNSSLPRTSRWWWYRTGDNTQQAPGTYKASPGNWNWGGPFAQWWRTWLIMYFAIVPSSTGGTAASVSATSGNFATLTGLAGVSASSVGSFVTISGAASSGNNGTFQITQWLSLTSVVIANANAVAGDANNGAIHWLIQSYPGVAPAAVWGAHGVVWGDTTRSWGLNTPPATGAAMRALLRTWKSGSADYPFVIIDFSGQTGVPGSEYSPWSIAGSGNPNGDYGRWSKTVNGVAVSARTSSVSPFDCFCDGSEIWQPKVCAIPLYSG